MRGRVTEEEKRAEVRETERLRATKAIQLSAGLDKVISDVAEKLAFNFVRHQSCQ